MCLINGVSKYLNDVEFNNLINDICNYLNENKKNNLFDKDENDNEYINKLEVAGVKKEEIEIKLIDNKKLTIEIKNEQYKKNNIHYMYTIHSYSDIELDKVKCNLELGILTIIIPKRIKDIRNIEIE